MLRLQLRRLLKSPWLQAGVGLVMVVSAFAELAGPLFGLGESGVGAEHGVLLYGFVQVAKGIVEGVEGAEKVEEALVGG